MPWHSASGRHALRLDGKCPDTARPEARCHGVLRSDSSCLDISRPEGQCAGKIEKDRPLSGVHSVTGSCILLIINALLLLL